MYLDAGIPVQLPAGQQTTISSLWAKTDPSDVKNSFVRVKRGCHLTPAADHSVRGNAGRWIYNNTTDSFELHAALPAVDADNLRVLLFAPVAMAASPAGGAIEAPVVLVKRPTLAQWSKAQAKKVCGEFSRGRIVPSEIFFSGFGRPRRGLCDGVHH